MVKIDPYLANPDAASMKKYVFMRKKHEFAPKLLYQNEAKMARKIP